MQIPAQLKNRKFWLTVVAILAAVSSFLAGEVSGTAALTAIVTAITGYNAAAGYVDGKRAERSISVA
jgi:hypothetical protein